MGLQFSWDSGISRRLKFLAMRSDSKRWWCRKVWQLLSCSTSWNCFLPEVVCDLTKPSYLICNLPMASCLFSGAWGGVRSWQDPYGPKFLHVSTLKRCKQQTEHSWGDKISFTRGDGVTNLLHFEDCNVSKSVHAKWLKTISTQCVTVGYGWIIHG